MKLLLPLLLPMASILAQSQSTGAATTHGSCSPASTGNRNVFTITCGIGKEQGDQMLKILNKILANQLDPTAVNTKLDEILAGVKGIEEANRPRHLTPKQKEMLISKLSSYPKPHLVFELLNGTAEVATFGDDFVEVFVQLGWLNKEKDWSMAIGASRATGLNFEVRSVKPGEYPAAADGLFSALKDIGLQPGVFTNDKMQTNEIKFYVSSRN